MKIKKGTKVAKEDGQDEYYIGTVKEIKEEKALVYFPTRGFSRWVNKSNLDVVTNSKVKN